MERGLLGAFGIGLALFCGLFAVTFAVEWASGGDGKTSPGVYAGLVVFFGGAFLTGAYLAWRMLRPRPATAGAARPGAQPSGRPGRRAGGRSGGRGASAEEERLSPPADPAERERRVLRLAERERGRVTAPEVAARCHMTVAEAKAVLDQLVVADAAELHVTDSGVLVYVFPGFLSDSDKARARDF